MDRISTKIDKMSETTVIGNKGGQRISKMKFCVEYMWMEASLDLILESILQFYKVREDRVNQDTQVSS